MGLPPGSAFMWLKDIFYSFTPLGIVMKNWEPISLFFDDLWKGITDKAMMMWGLIEPVINAAKSLFGGDNDAVVELASNNAPRPSRGQRGGAATRNRLLNQTSQANVGGQLDININSQGQATVAKVKSETPGFDFNVDSGMNYAGVG